MTHGRLLDGLHEYWLKHQPPFPMDSLFVPHFRSIRLSELRKSSMQTTRREFMTWTDFGAVPT